jgi:hypothetical protein
MKATLKGVESIALFVAELNGYKAGPSMEDKYHYGIKCWMTNKLHDLDLATEKDRKDMYENIWLERLYKDLDNAFNLTGIDGDIQKAMYTSGMDVELELDDSYSWTTPVELDAGALA